jgi:RHS repeat-associated protein
VRFPGGERLELRYDVRSRVVEERYLAASGGELRRLAFAYDLANREIELRDGAAPLRSVRIAAGRVAEERLGNGLVRTYGYDGRTGRIDAIAMRDPAGALVESTRLAIDALGASLHVATTTAGALPFTSHEHFTLGPIADGEPGARVLAWSRAASGADPTRFDHDALGNLAASGTDDGAGRAFSFDAQRTRLLRIRNAAGTLRHEYAYDEAGFAVRRDGADLTWDAGGRPTAAGAGARFRWDALGRLVDVTVEGAARRRVFGGRGIADAAGFPVALELGALTLDLLGNHRYRHLDFRGNVKLVSDAGGRIVLHARHAPYGADRLEGAPDPEAGFAQGRGAGGELVLLGARLYEPEAGRFLAPDPVFQLVNQYAYADGNPIWYWDPDGRDADLAIGVALGVALGTACVGAVIGVPALTIFAFAFAIGVATPPNWLATATASFGYGALRTTGAVPILQAGFGGFTIGQGVRGAIEGALGDGTVFDPDKLGDGKEIELDFEGPGAIGGGLGGVHGTGGPSGCSPIALARSPHRVARETLYVMLGCQLLLGALVLRGRLAR